LLPYLLITDTEELKQETEEQFRPAAVNICTWHHQLVLNVYLRHIDGQSKLHNQLGTD